MNNSNHTPTPWTWEGEFGTLRGNGGSEVGYSLPIAKDDAAFIIRAVNSHEELLKLVKDLNYAFYVVGTPKAVKET